MWKLNKNEIDFTWSSYFGEFIEFIKTEKKTGIYDNMWGVGFGGGQSKDKGIAFFRLANPQT